VSIDPTTIAPTTVGLYAWHVHHERLVEVLTEPIQARIEYIRRQKPESEVATRLRLLRLVGDQEAVAAAEKPYQEALAAAEKTYDDCLLYTSPSPRDLSTSRMPSSA